MPALKGLLEMALPAQVGESPRVCFGMVFMEHSLSLPSLKKTVVKGGVGNSIPIFITKGMT